MPWSPSCATDDTTRFDTARSQNGLSCLCIAEGSSSIENEGAYVLRLIQTNCILKASALAMRGSLGLEDGDPCIQAE